MPGSDRLFFADGNNRQSGKSLRLAVRHIQTAFYRVAQSLPGRDLGGTATLSAVSGWLRGCIITHRIASELRACCLRPGVL